jgi:GNAT superfamily N-acetyltransferase
MSTPTPDAGVRPARPQDAASIGQVHANAWQASYAQLLPDRSAAALAPQALAESWLAAVSDPPSPQHRVLVATAGPDVVAFVALSPGTDADAAPGQDAEILVLLVDPESTGRGHGSRLLNASVDTLRDNGFTVLRAWVPEPDEDRQRFLAGAGFTVDGATRVLDASGDGTATVRELRWSASIGSSDR